MRRVVPAPVHDRRDPGMRVPVYDGLADEGRPAQVLAGFLVSMSAPEDAWAEHVQLLSRIKSAPRS